MSLREQKILSDFYLDSNIQLIDPEIRQQVLNEELAGLESFLYRYERDIVSRRNKFEINVKARQIGYSFSFAYKVTKTCIFGNRDQLIVSSSHRQSKRVMYYVEKFIRMFQKLPSQPDLKLLVNTQTEKRFQNDKQILCLPPNPETIRGFPGDVLLDEFALYKEDSKIYEAILPAITGGHKGESNYSIVISSTPLGLQNKFYEIWNDVVKFKGFARHQINIFDAIQNSDGLFNPDIDAIKENYDEQSFRQEYLCEFIDESTAYFNYELLKSCIDEFEAAELKGRTFIGIDVGRSHDLTCIAVLKEVNNRFYLKRIERLKNVAFDVQKETIIQIFHEEDPNDVLIDKGLLGMQLAEELSEEFSFVTGIQMTNMVKNNCATFTKKLMEQKNFKISDDRELITSFHSIKKNVTADNIVKFQSPKDKRGHGDDAWSVMLAALAIKTQSEIKMAIIK